MPKKFSFPREKYALKSKKIIEQILSNGNKILEYPILLKWLSNTGQESSLKIAFIVSKKKINKATKRNLIRRRLRESLRMFLPQLLSKLPNNTQFYVLIIYLADKPLPYSIIFEKLNSAFVRLLDSNLNNTNQ